MRRVASQDTEYVCFCAVPMSWENATFTESLTCLPTVTRAVGSDSPFSSSGVIAN